MNDTTVTTHSWQVFVFECFHKIAAKLQPRKERKKSFYCFWPVRISSVPVKPVDSGAPFFSTLTETFKRWMYFIARPVHICLWSLLPRGEKNGASELFFVGTVLILCPFHGETLGRCIILGWIIRSVVKLNSTPVSSSSPGMLRLMKMYVW